MKKLLVILSILLIIPVTAFALSSEISFDDFCDIKLNDTKTNAADFICELDIYEMDKRIGDLEISTQKQILLDNFVSQYYNLTITQNQDNLYMDLANFTYYDINVGINDINGTSIDGSFQSLKPSYVNQYNLTADTSYLESGKYVFVASLSSAITPTLLFPFEIQ